MKSFREIRQAAAYFKENHPACSECVLTEGPNTHEGPDRYKQVREGFRQCGVFVTVQGEYGNRTITLRGFAKINREVRGRYTRSRRLDDRHILQHSIAKLAVVGATAYIEGNQHYIRRKLRRYYGLFSCSVVRHENGLGYNVTRSK